MTIKEKIDQDLKTAMLGGEKTLVTTLRGLKSAILYAEVAANKRIEGLSDPEVIQVFSKEHKKRLESAGLYGQGGDLERQQAEQTEAEVIAAYLPKQLTEAELKVLVKETVAKLGAGSINDMGRVIEAIKQQTAGSADMSLVSRLVKDRLVAG